ncbi:hypothetical protein UY3_12000 [Chelonia mydas]|uniref:Uncharacterized protein n=1 Tax=Chelonia mydas TaxID=8469 RepID=M7BFL7_CHEMY|nr:hypothetical protein UY3_12000 [Chelonia mydas]
MDSDPLVLQDSGTLGLSPRFAQLGECKGEATAVFSAPYLLPPPRPPMASPRLETYCCPNRDAATQLVLTFQPEVFCGVCIGSASVSLLLSILQLLPKQGQSSRKMQKASSSTTILLFISVCDLLGDLGIIFRSAVWIGFPDFIANISVVNGTDVLPSAFCVGSACRHNKLIPDRSAIDSGTPPGQEVEAESTGEWQPLIPCREDANTIVLYHMMTWGLAILLCVEGIAMLYYPSIASCENGLQHAIPHYITTYAPLLLVLVANPILFRRTVTGGLEDQLSLVLPAADHGNPWSSNIINESLLFYLEMQPDINGNPLKNVRNAALITWIIMGVLNPMQGFLFTLAFYGWTGWKLNLKWQKREIPWESMSTSAVADNGYPSAIGSSVNYQSNIHNSKTTTIASSQQTDEALSMLSEGSDASTIEIQIPSELHDLEDNDADVE